MAVAISAAKVQHRDAPSPAVARAFRPDIEGLRAIAVLMVLLDHAGLAFLSGGYVGVDVFFVLSGFLITGLLLKEIERGDGISLTKFYARRARRLLPAGSLVLLVTVAASYLYLGESRANRVGEDARWASLFASNFRFIQQRTDYLDAQLPPSPLQHFWSLAVEEQFYAVWPALIILFAAIAKRIPIRVKLSVALTGIILASLAWSIHQTELNGTAAYFSPFPRACELGAGALLAVIAPWLLRFPRPLGTVLSLGGIVMILAAGLLFDASTRFPGYAVALPVMGTVFAVAGGSVAPGVGAELVLRQRPFQWIGKLSYSLYLWHWPLLVIAAGRAGHELSLVQNLLLCALALPLSAATYLLVEDPIRDSSRLKQRSPVVSVAFGLCLVLLSFGASAWMIDHHGAPVGGEGVAAMAEFQTRDEVVRAVAEGVNVKEWPPQPDRIANPGYSKECDVTLKDTTSSVCVHGDPNGTRSVVIYGDSHATQWLPAFDLIGKQQGWRVIQLTKPGCQVADFPRFSSTLKREYTECAKYREFALAQIEQIRPDVVVLSSAGKDARMVVDGKATSRGVEEAWATGLASMIRRITPLTGKVIVLGDMAYPSEPGIDCLTAHAGEAKACNTSRADAVFTEHNAMEARVAADSGAAYIDVIPWFCTETACPAVIGGLTVHRDSYHVAENYAYWLSSVLGVETGLLPEETILTPA